MPLIVKSNIRKTVKDLDKEGAISSIADEVALALERKVEEILLDGIKRAKENGRKTLQARDL
ncbi:NFYB/HAP3 family transcription factor subunit [Candidatus Pacearchaeota archaeon]|nr:NFYB/HAP3 family transcription factor subunit [Candidatus Pacearchaeota archaeon]